LYVTLANFVVPLIGPYLYQRDAKLAKEYKEYEEQEKRVEMIMEHKDENSPEKINKNEFFYVDAIHHATAKIEPNSTFAEVIWGLFTRIYKSGTMVATFAGLACGLIPWTNYIFFNNDSFFKVITDVMKFMGDMNIPMSNLTLGYILYHISETQKPLNLSKVDIWMITIARMFILPLIGIAVIMSFRYTTGGYYNDIVFAFTQYFQWCTPAAVSLLFYSLKAGQGSDEVSSIILYHTMISVISMTWNATLFSYIYLKDPLDYLG